MEHYTARHSDTFEELLEWPWQRFEACYQTFVKRELVERLEHKRDLMVSAIWSNSVYDEHEEADRTKAIEQIDEKFDEVIEYIRNGGKSPDEEEIDFDSNPFFAAGKRGLDRVAPPRDEDGQVITTAGQVAEDEKETQFLMSQLDQS